MFGSSSTTSSRASACTPASVIGVLMMTIFARFSQGNLNVYLGAAVAFPAYASSHRYRASPSSRLPTARSPRWSRTVAAYSLTPNALLQPGKPKRRHQAMPADRDAPTPARRLRLAPPSPCHALALPRPRRKYRPTGDTRPPLRTLAAHD